MSLIVSLSDVEEKYWSHPYYPYKKHIQNIADSFPDRSHKESALFHDTGKLPPPFQEYINPEHSNNRKTTHSLEGALLFLRTENYELNRDTFPIFFTIAKHHANLDDVDTFAESFSYYEECILKNHPDIEKTVLQIQKIAGFKEDFSFGECCDFLGTDSFVKENELSGLETYFTVKEVFSKLIFADKYEAIFKKAFQEKGFEKINRYIEILETIIAKKQNTLSPVRNQARLEALDTFYNNQNNRIYLLEAPTGIGKTYMALHLALEIARTKKKKRIITALPMTSIIDQTHEDYSLIFEEKVLMKYHHLTYSKKYLDSDNELEAEQESFLQKNAYLNKSWAEDKVIVTTFNQLLNLFYSNKNSDLIKFWTLRDSVIIIDEVQAIPRILLKDFSETINFLSHTYRIDFILMSATIPDIKSFFKKDTICELLDTRFFAMDFNNRYTLKIDKSIDSEERLVSQIINKYKENQSVLTVVNTKKLALEIYEQVKNEVSHTNVFLLSSLFIPKQRKKIINEVKNILKERKIILISTQVIEAGVDLDFDKGFREFCPFYSIIQTAGRINRENREEVREHAKLVIVPPIGASPYHNKDLLENFVFDFFPEKVRENQLLPFLKKYFTEAINRTYKKSILISKMENLDFLDSAKTFNENFMQKLPYLIPVFIEYEKGLYDSICLNLKEKYQILKEKELPLEKKMEIKIEISDIYKKIAQYLINVPGKDVYELDLFYKEEEMKVCPFEKLDSYYSGKTGFKVNLEQKENLFIF